MLDEIVNGVIDLLLGVFSLEGYLHTDTVSFISQVDGRIVDSILLVDGLFTQSGSVGPYIHVSETEACMRPCFIEQVHEKSLGLFRFVGETLFAFVDYGIRMLA
ncbi:hypothetical protein BK647_07255 [Pseudomonas protegens]|nr:hypothetical protein BK647_07255 [Pseudomonas protegens]